MPETVSNIHQPGGFVYGSAEVERAPTISWSPDQLKTSSKQTVGRPVNGQSAAGRLLEYLIYDRTSIYSHY